ncbi:type III-B CRISPR module-associated protein Cmr5 [Vibrio sp. WXL210]|uniref:type III-B CRISPR module-associated protein Cmr5 n=1 Tax=Vibrio sp. WXL210 TaxID=3450709 RepID=UPI003EC6536D
MPRYKKQAKKTQTAPKQAAAREVQLNAEQTRAKYALSVITELTSGPSALSNSAQKELKAYVQALPAMVQINGLGQAIAFYRSRFQAGESSKGGVAYQKLYDLLSDWLCKGPLAVYPSHHDLLTALVSEDMHKYRMAQIELLAFLGWVQKFVLAFVAAEKPETLEEA